MKNFNVFIYRPLIILVSFIAVAIGIDYLLSFLGFNLPFIRYLIYIIVTILGFVSANSGVIKLEKEAENISLASRFSQGDNDQSSFTTEIEQFEPIVKEINANKKHFETEVKLINKSLDNLLKTGRDDRFKELSDKIASIELQFSNSKKYGNKWDNISKAIIDLQEEIAKKDIEIEKIKLGNKKLVSEINIYSENIEKHKNEISFRDLEIKALKDKIEKSKVKEHKISIASGSVPITAPKRAMNVSEKDFIDFAGRGFGKY